MNNRNGISVGTENLADESRHLVASAQALTSPAAQVSADRVVGTSLEVAMVTVHTPVCGLCGKRAVVSLTDEQYIAYNSGNLIQVSLPDVPNEVREMLISGTHPACWTKVFGEDHEECVVCGENHTCDDRRLPDGDCECCWLAEK